MARKQHHSKRREASPQRRDEREKRRQHHAHQRELHHHADCSNKQTAMHSQAEYHGEAGIDKNKNTCCREVPVAQGDIAVHCGASPRTCPASTTRSRCATRLACSPSCVTHNTARPVRMRALISDSTAATEATSRAAVGSSSNSTFGRIVSARASASRSRSPVDSRAIGHAFVCSAKPRSLTKTNAAVQSPKCSPTVFAHQPGSAGT